ncbi:MAG TPA: RsmD family RNA methyltransferase [Candidatus Sulfotelmatobacter sp.]|nr:RsmD family RNA methyltransferase [Candidatus Sulfotelmatobacter sp.]
MADAGRVVGGTARGTRLLAPGPGTRPLTDRVKEALFGILEAATLAPWPAPFLDGFAGSGAAGIEALSRDAPAALFVERDRGACRVIEANLVRAAVADRGRVVPGDVGRLLETASPAGVGGPFGAVLLDPPYGDATLGTALGQLGRSDRGWLREEAVVVAKHFWRDTPAERVGSLVLRRTRRFGETQLSFYTREP